MATIEELQLRQLQARQEAVRRRLAGQQSQPAPAVDTPPTIEPQPATRPQERSFWQRADEMAGNLAQGIRQGITAFTQGATAGASDEILAAGDAALGRGSLQENLAARQKELADVPAAIRTPAEVAGGLFTTLPAGAVLNTVPGALGYGALYGFNAGNGDLEERATSSAIGAGASLAGELGARGLARMISPKSSPQVQQLRKSGVTPTPGQTLGGVARDVEEKLASIPVLGSAIRMGERRAIRQFNTGAVNNALGRAGLKIPGNTPPGHAAIAAAGEALSQGYDDALRGINISMDDQFADDIARLTNKAKAGLNDDGFGAVQREVRKFLSLPEVQQNRIAGRTAKQILSDLRSRARAMGKDQSIYVRDAGEVIGDLADTFDDLLKRNLPPENAAQLGRLDRAYGDFLRLEEAGARIGADEGAFTPAQLRSAVRKMDDSLRKRAFARGQARLQDFAESGQGVLGGNVPNSGTFDRAALATMLAGGYAYDPLVGTAIAIPAAAYTPLGQRSLAALLAGRQGPAFQSAAQGVRSLAPAAAVAAPAVINANR